MGVLACAEQIYNRRLQRKTLIFAWARLSWSSVTWRRKTRNENGEEKNKEQTALSIVCNVDFFRISFECRTHMREEK
jgi:hypothetical protein